MLHKMLQYGELRYLQDSKDLLTTATLNRFAWVSLLLGTVRKGRIISKESGPDIVLEQFR